MKPNQFLFTQTCGGEFSNSQQTVEPIVFHGHRDTSKVAASAAAAVASHAGCCAGGGIRSALPPRIWLGGEGCAVQRGCARVCVRAQRRRAGARA